MVRRAAVQEPDLRLWKRTTSDRPIDDVPRTSSPLDLWAIFSLVFVLQFVAGMWMNARGFIWNDAVSRAAGALTAVYSAEPGLADIGFIWMPLPALAELPWVSQYPTWPGVVSSGFASTITTAIAGGATAALLLFAARSFGLPEWFGWVHALLVAANPMLFLYAGNGMSEGVAAPFLVGAVAFVALFWHTGRRKYVGAAGLALGVGLASLYQAVPYGAALVAALLLGALSGSREMLQPAPGRRWKHATVAATLLLVPSLVVATLWVWANSVFAGDPLHFAISDSSNLGYTALVGTGREHLQGDIQATLGYVAVRTAPFLIPGVVLIILRLLDGRFRRINTLSLALLLVSVPAGLIGPLLYVGASFGWLRFFVYPLFVAAGWGLFEVASSRRPRRAMGVVLAGWVIAAPVVFWAMADPELGREEHHQARALLLGADARGIGFDVSTASIARTAPVARYLDALPPAERVALATDGWSIVAQVSPERLKNIVLVQDSGFRDAIDDPGAHDVDHLLVPNPVLAPGDAIGERWPALWSGGEPRFRLVEDFPDTPRQWRLFKVVE